VKIQIAIGGKVYEVEIENEDEEYAVGELPREAPIQSQRVPTASRREPSSETDASDSSVCRSPVAGIVTRVAVRAGDSFRVIDAFSRIIRLGEGVSRSGRISEAAIERAVEALAVCRDKMRNRGVTRARLIATEACRAAENSVEFRARIAEKVGLDLEVIDRQTEATLAATGCTPLMDPYADGVILFDIGGGSSELVRLDRSPQCRRGPPLPKIRAWISLPLGVVTLAERHGGHVVTPEIYAAMIAEVTTFVSPFVAEHGGLGSGHMHLLGTSGTVTTIAGVHLELRRLDIDPYLIDLQCGLGLTGIHVGTRFLDCRPGE